jgi:hypothetical protein
MDTYQSLARLPFGCRSAWLCLKLINLVLELQDPGVGRLGSPLRRRQSSALGHACLVVSLLALPASAFSSCVLTFHEPTRLSGWVVPFCCARESLPSSSSSPLCSSPPPADLARAIGFAKVPGVCVADLPICRARGVLHENPVG